MSDTEVSLSNANDKHQATTAKRPARKVHEEEKFVDDVERIVERDFFPDLPKLRAKQEYFDAVQSGDLSRLQLVREKYSACKLPLGQTPSYTASVRTDIQPPTPSSVIDLDDDAATSVICGPTVVEGEQELSGVSLDAYLARNTSEDNASFDALAAEADRRRREKFAWFYEQEDKMLKAGTIIAALPGVEEQATALPKGSIETWSGYRAQNSLMYPPEAPNQRCDSFRQLVHTNTRFRAKPFPDSDQQFAKPLPPTMPGKVGVDGKELQQQPQQQQQPLGQQLETPSYLRTPSPAPGHYGESPFMTWGEIDGTPFRLDGSDTPTTDEDMPRFRIPQSPAGPAELASKVNKYNKRHKQLLAARTNSQRVESLSPAARRLLTISRSPGIFGSGDKSLRASYRSPLISPRRHSSRSNNNSSSSVRSSTSTSRITDNLLHCSK